MNSFGDEIQGKKVLIFGVGRQGGGAGDAQWLRQHGADVRLSDKDVGLCPEGQTKEQIEWADIIIKNPAVAESHELLVYAASLEKPMLTSIALVVKMFSQKIIGVTGTRGKSTTTALIVSMLERAFPNQIITGGNIPGTSGLTLLDQLATKKYGVLELSSFQLHGLHELKISPHISIITNLYPDHLNRYRDMASYQKDKEAIVAYQKQDDITLYNADNSGARAIAAAATGTQISYTASQVASWQTSLPGSHNRENLAAMWAVGHALGLSESLCREVAADFRGLPYRQEVVSEVGGVTFINDTTATTPTATMKALATLTKPTLWIVGGDTKNLPFDDLLSEVSTNPYLKHIILLGSKNIPDFVGQLKQVIGTKIIGQVSSMSDAVTLAMRYARSGDVVLLSPAFASFDLFQNEFDRGRQFNEAVTRV